LILRWSSFGPVLRFFAIYHNFLKKSSFFYLQHPAIMVYCQHHKSFMERL
jgi:hypothetical protein